MAIHGIRPELQPTALAEKAAQKAEVEVNNEEIKQELVGSNHDAPGVDQATDSSALTGLGTTLNTQA